MPKGPFSLPQRGPYILPLWGLWAPSGVIYRGPPSSCFAPLRFSHVVGRNICPKGTTPSGIYSKRDAPLAALRPLWACIVLCRIDFVDPRCPFSIYAQSPFGNICPKGLREMTNMRVAHTAPLGAGSGTNLRATISLYNPKVKLFF